MGKSIMELGGWQQPPTPTHTPPVYQWFTGQREVTVKLKEAQVDRLGDPLTVPDRPESHQARPPKPRLTRRCTKPNCTPLSATKIPFGGTVWVDPLETRGDKAGFVNRHLDRRIRDKAGRVIRNSFGQNLIDIKGLTFDEVPLGYLDWLSGQPWLYGPFAHRLSLYLSHPAIQKELEALFPDPEDDSRQPPFMAAAVGPGLLQSAPNGVGHDRWHSQPMPKEEVEPTFYKGRTWAWRVAADLLLSTEAEPEFAEAQVINFEDVRQAAKLLPKEVVDRLRAALRAQQQKLKERAERELLQLEIAEYAWARWQRKLRTAKARATKLIRKEAATFILQRKLS